MTAAYTFDVFSSLDGYGSYGDDGDRGGYWRTLDGDIQELVRKPTLHG